MWWYYVAEKMNGMCHCEMGKLWPVVLIHTDASLSGFGAVYQGLWLAGTCKSVLSPPIRFSRNWVPAPELHESFRSNINFLELLAACLPLLIWGPLFSGQLIIIMSDNTQTVSFVNRGTTKNAAALKWLKYVIESSVANNFRVASAYSPAYRTCLLILSGVTECTDFETKFFAHFQHIFPWPQLPEWAFCSFPLDRTEIGIGKTTV